MPTFRAAALIAFSLGTALSCPVPALSQEATAPGITTYPDSFFDHAQPSTSLEMVQLLPGFLIIEGDAELRGYSGATGNVLIDGQRPSSKQETLEDILRRIPASEVARVELIKGGSGYDMQGYALLANVVRRSASRLSGQVEAEGALFRHGYSAPRLAGQLTFRPGNRVIDLSAAIYREIDDEHGFGLRNYYADDGSVVRQAAYGQPEGDNVREVTARYRQGALGGTLHLNGLYKHTGMFANITDRVSVPATFLATGTERVGTDATELGAQFERDLGRGNQIELLAIRRTTDVDGVKRSIEPGGTAQTTEVVAATETIGRATLRHTAGHLALETGAEGTLNIYDSSNALIEDGVDIPLPASDVRVEEKRAELFATANWQAAKNLSVEAGTRYEFSRLTQSGDSTASQDLQYLKPRAMVRWSPGAHDELRISAEREVGQLAFENFIGSASLTSGTVTAGNKDLVPESLWRAELAWEHRLGQGTLVLTARHEWIRNVIDRTPIVTTDGIFDAVGNVGSASRDELQAGLNLPLDQYGLKGFTVQADALYRRSSLTDPTTGEHRRISEDLPFESEIHLTHDLPQWHLRWGADFAFATREASYRIDEVEVQKVPERLGIFMEYKPDSLWTLRLFGKNLTNSAVTRERSIYSGLRNSAPLDFTELRVLNSGPYFGINIRRRFGN